MAEPQKKQTASSIFGIPVPQPTEENPYSWWNPLRSVEGLRDTMRYISTPGNILPADVSRSIMQDVNSYVGNASGEKAKPAPTAKKPVAARSVFPESFSDPTYDAAEANASKITGVPQDLLRAIRLRGERSNASAVSSAGARTPYQIIPGTAAGIKQNYGIDPLKDPMNAALGAAYVLREQAGGQGADGPNWADPMTRLRAVGGYFGGAAGAANPTSQTLRDANMSVNEYTRRVLGDNLVSGFNPTFAQAALGQSEQARLAASRPEQFAFNVGPMPEVPKPEAVPKTDWTAVESRLEMLRPVEWTMKEAENARWKNFWGSLGQAMMSSPEGEGLGSFFLRLGGAGLASAAMTRDEVQQRKDKFDTQMAKYNAALYEHDFTKAQVMQRELMADWENNRQYALQTYEQGMQLWQKNALSSQVVGDRLVTHNVDKNGNVKVNMTPIQGMIDAAAAERNANIYMQAFGVQNADSAAMARVMNGTQAAITTAQIGQLLADDSVPESEKAAAQAYAQMLPITDLVEGGKIASFLGEEEFDAMNKSIMRELTPRIQLGAKGYDEAYKNMAKRQLLDYLQRNPEEYQRLVETVGSAASLFDMAEQYGTRQVTQTTNARGQTTSRVEMGNE